MPRIFDCGLPWATIQILLQVRVADTHDRLSAIPQQILGIVSSFFNPGTDRPIFSFYGGFNTLRFRFDVKAPWREKA